MTRTNTAADSVQLTFQNPVTRCPTVYPPIQRQPEPGLDTDLAPKADHGESSYRGTGRFNGRRALIIAGDSRIGPAVGWLSSSRPRASGSMRSRPAPSGPATGVGRTGEGGDAEVRPGLPHGRAGQPTELAPAYVFLASPESSYVIGETLHVNGDMPTP